MWSMENRIVTINVGGEVFVTTSSTLRSLPNTLLADLVDPKISFDEAVEVRERLFQIRRLSCFDLIGAEFAKELDQENEGQIFGDNQSLSQEACRSRYIYFTDTSGNLASQSNSSPVHVANGYKTPTRFKESGVKNRHESQLSESESIRTSDTIQSSQSPKKHHSYFFHGQQRQQKFPSQHHRQHCPHDSIFVSLPSAQTADLFIDRNPVLMPYILDAYRHGQLHLPSNVCSFTIRAELEFWKISENFISECCWKNFAEGLKTMKVVEAITASLHDPYDTPKARADTSRRHKLWLTLEKPSYSVLAKIWCIFFYLCIFLSCLSFMLLSVNRLTEVKPEFQDLMDYYSDRNLTAPITIVAAAVRNVKPMLIIDHFLRVFFMVDLILRFLVCPNRKVFVRDGHNVTNLVILVLEWLHWALDLATTRNPKSLDETRGNILIVLACATSARCLRTLHLLKHLRPLKVMYLSIRASFRELMLLVIVMTSAVLLFGTIIYLAELLNKDDADDINFFNIPIAMWWALITMTTVGYGDFYPTTPAGYLVGVACAMTGLLLVAMPIAIVASKFTNYYDNMTSRDQAIRRENYVKKLRQQQDEHDTKLNRGDGEIYDGLEDSVSKDKKIGYDSFQDSLYGFDCYELHGGKTNNNIKTASPVRDKLSNDDNITRTAVVGFSDDHNDMTSSGSQSETNLGQSMLKYGQPQSKSNLTKTVHETNSIVEADAIISSGTGRTNKTAKNNSNVLNVKATDGKPGPRGFSSAKVQPIC